MVGSEKRLALVDILRGSLLKCCFNEKKESTGFLELAEHLRVSNLPAHLLIKFRLTCLTRTSTLTALCPSSLRLDSFLSQQSSLFGQNHKCEQTSETLKNAYYQEHTSCPNTRNIWGWITLCYRAILFTVGYVIPFPAYTHWIPLALYSSCVNQNSLQTFLSVPGEHVWRKKKVPPVEA